jgi:hypothetical protein
VLAREETAQGWVVLIPGESPAADYNRLLAAFPVTLIDETTQALLRQPEQPETIIPNLLLANYTGHKLPWPYGIAAYVTQKDTTYHMNQIDFDIQGLAASGDVVATKPGTVVFVKESSSTTCSTPAPDPCWKKSNMVVVQHPTGEYSWYVHLVYNSVPVIVGQYVDYGTKVGVEGRTGYSTGVHLHYMASSGHSTWTDPNNPNDAPWGTGITAVDFAEYSWANLIQTYDYTYTSQNASNLPAPCPGAGGVLLYRNAQYQCAGQGENSGYVLRTGLGFQNLPASFDNSASSVRVPAGKSVLLYADADRGGGKKCFDSPGDTNFSDDTFDTGGSLDNQVSSFVVFPAPGCPAPPAVDLIAPTGNLTSPSAGAAVGRQVQLSATASDGSSGVQLVRFIAQWSGQPSRVISTDRTAPYAYSWDLCASAIPNGDIEIKVEVVDNAWNTFTSPGRHVTATANCAAPSGASWSADFWANTSLAGSPALHLAESTPFLFHNWAAASPGAGIPNVGWSARFTRAASFSGGEYRFHCQSSDGCRVIIDNQERISAWQDANFTGTDWTGTLTAGSHEIKVEYYDNTGDARLEVWWQGAGFLPREAACDPNQWCLDIWGNAGLAGTAALHRAEGELLAHNWGSAGPDSLFPATFFSSRAVRSAYFDCGTYRFTAVTAGGLRFWLDDILHIDQQSEPTQPASYTADVAIGPNPGPHNLKVEHFESASPAALSLAWTKISACPVSTTVGYTTTEYTRPGAAIEPSVQVRVTTGYLDPARGDRLALVSGSDLSATASPQVRSLVSAGQAYAFDASLGFKMTAPLAQGTHTGSWNVMVDGSPVGLAAEIMAIVDNQAPQVSITGPTGYLTGRSITVQASATDSTSGISHVQFFAGYDAGSGWAWHSIGYDLDGSDGWSKAWNTSAVPDQTSVAFFVNAWDRAGNGNGKRSADFILDRTPPAATITDPAPTQDSTRFIVRWEVSDNLTGLNDWDIQYQKDGSATWLDWLMNRNGSARSAWFTSVMGHDYAFRIRARDIAGNVGEYTTTSITHINTCTPNDFEPDDDKDHARPIQVDGAAEIHKICGAGDVDWYAFTPDPATTYIIDTNQLGLTTDTILTLFKADGSTILAENGGAGGTQASSVLARPTGEPILYIRIRHTSPPVAGDAVTYNLSIVPVRALIFLPVLQR